jgi:hypothetical protein
MPQWESTYVVFQESIRNLLSSAQIKKTIRPIIKPKSSFLRTKNQKKSNSAIMHLCTECTCSAALDNYILFNHHFLHISSLERQLHILFWSLTRDQTFQCSFSLLICSSHFLHCNASIQVLCANSPKENVEPLSQYIFKPEHYEF